MKYFRMFMVVMKEVNKIRADGKVTVDECVQLVRVILGEFGLNQVVLINQDGSEEQMK